MESKDPDRKPPFQPYAKHILVCTGSKCAPDEGLNLYHWLKERLRELGLHSGAGRIQRSRCQCLGVCEGGPIVVVYPDEVWYHHVTQKDLEKIIQEHLLRDKPVEEKILDRRTPRDK